MNKKILWIVGAVVGFGLIALMAVSIASEPERDPSIGFGEVTVEGANLPYIQDLAAGDPTVGIQAPTVSGADWNGNEYTVGADGRPKILSFLAHWCSHCDAEVPVVQQWVDDGNLPDDVDMYAFTIRTSDSRPDWPPQDWLEGYGWTVPTIMDDAAGSVDSAFGVVGTPFYVVLDGDNNNLGRISGAVGPAGLDALVRIAQDSASG